MSVMPDRNCSCFGPLAELRFTLRMIVRSLGKHNIYYVTKQYLHEGLSGYGRYPEVLQHLRARRQQRPLPNPRWGASTSPFRKRTQRMAQASQFRHFRRSAHRYDNTGSHSGDSGTGTSHTSMIVQVAGRPEDGGASL